MKDPAPVQTVAHEEHVKALDKKDQEIGRLKETIATLLELLYAPKRERFIPDPSTNQGELFADEILPVEEVPEEEETVTIKKKRGRRLPSGRKFPDHLPVEEIVLDPEGDLSHLTKIGEDVREILRYNPASFSVLRIKRSKYCDPKNPAAGVLMASLPAEVIGKCTASAGLLSHVVVNKYVHHMPIERMLHQFSQAGLALPKSTVTGWIQQVSRILAPLGELLREEILNGGYIQADETRIPVQDRAKSKQSGKHHTGYYWIYSDPVSNLVMFDYQQDRSRDGPATFLKGFKGALQTDGYIVYDWFDQLDEITQYCCWAHARRYFYRAKRLHPKYAKVALALIQRLYAVERKLRQGGASFEERAQVRQRRSVPILDKLKAHLEGHPTFKGCPWNIAVCYTLNRWDQLTRFTRNGIVEIDNNLVENRIRPVALGRKNYLFAGSHDAAKGVALLYSLLSTCKQHNVKYMVWLEDVLKQISKLPASQLHTLLPHHWKVNREVTLAKAA